MARDNQNPLLNHALEYHRRGWCIIPVPYGKKAARIKWAKYQKSRPDEKQLAKWFGNGKRNIAVVLGPVSGDLVCRDFDTVQAYESWAAAYPDLAQRLPTVRTARGYHVYFQARIDGIKHLPDGELRAGGGYCLLPASVHPEGPVYQWAISLTEANLVVLDPARAGFLPNLTEQTEHTKHTEQTEHAETIGGKGDERVWGIIRSTLPKTYGQRNQKIFFLALHIRSICWNGDPKEFRWAVQEWHKLALANIKTKDFVDSWCDFLVAWGKLKHRMIDVIQVFEFSKDLEPPERLVRDWPDNRELHRLCVWCRELHKAHAVFGSTAYLGCRTIGKALRISHETGNNYFKILALEGYLKIVAIGKMTPSGGVATRFIYIGS